MLRSTARCGRGSMNGNMARVCMGKVSVLRKSVDILKCIETLPVIYCRYSSCDTSQRSWEPVEKETHTGQVCYVHFLVVVSLKFRFLRQ